MLLLVNENQHGLGGIRSYNAVMALEHHGYNKVYNISGSFFGISLYEYFNDQQLGREPIVTQYNFK